MRFIRHCLRVLLAIVAGLAILGFLALSGCSAGCSINPQAPECNKWRVYRFERVK